jgi:hypothetical protein
MNLMNVGKSLAVVGILALAGVVLGADKAPSKAAVKKPAPKLCLGAVDPFDRATQKTGFYAIAGKDGELTKDEFLDAAEKTSTTKSFLRSFDKFESLMRFNKDKNKTIDWVEAEAYRVDLRKRVLAAFDTNKDSRLKGPEREAANRALAAGKFARAGGMAGRRASFMSKWDKDGDGKLSDAEREAMRESYRKRSMEKWDKDGDGKLSDEERQAMRKGRRGGMGEVMERWRLQTFDIDGDGKLNEAEEAERKEFQGQFRDMGKRIDVRFNDLDGDGTVSREERQKIMREWSGSALKMMAMAATYMDRDGDGTVSADERTGFMKKVQTGMVKWMEDFGAEFDKDSSGRLDKKERTAFVAGMEKNIITRVGRFDADKDGRLNPSETIDMIKDFAKEIDIVPSEAKLKALEEGDLRKEK